MCSSDLGPSVLVLAPDPGAAEEVVAQVAATGGWRALAPGIARTGAVVSVLGDAGDRDPSGQR